MSRCRSPRDLVPVQELLSFITAAPGTMAWLVFRGNYCSPKGSAGFCGKFTSDQVPHRSVQTEETAASLPHVCIYNLCISLPPAPAASPQPPGRWTSALRGRRADAQGYVVAAVTPLSGSASEYQTEMMSLARTK